MRSFNFDVRAMFDLNQVFKDIEEILRENIVYNLFSEIAKKVQWPYQILLAKFINNLRENYEPLRVLVEEKNVEPKILAEYISYVIKLAEKYELELVSLNMNLFKDVEIPNWIEVVLIIKVRSPNIDKIFNYWSEISKNKKGSLKALAVEVEPVE